MRILQIIGSLDPKLGGPIAVAKTLRAALSERGHTVHLLTFSAPCEPPIDVSAMEIRLGPTFHPVFRFVPTLESWLSSEENRYDAIIVHGLWMYYGIVVRRIARRFGTRYFVFLHGSLLPRHPPPHPIKTLKKWIYWILFEWRNLRDATAVLFTSETERELTRGAFRPYRVNEAVIENGIADPAGDRMSRLALFHRSFPELADKRILLFLSRIDRVKGLDNLIEAFCKVSAEDASLHLVIAGPEADDWGRRLRERAYKLRIGHRITWAGMLTGELKWGAYHAAELFCLPSHGENFGVVVAEALSLGTPVLISNKVNICREIESAGAGIVVDDTKEDTTAGMLRWHAMSASEREEYGARARSCFERHFDIRSTSESIHRLIASNRH